jgi:AcrR family transcriptional regulator
MHTSPANRTIVATCLAVSDGGLRPHLLNDITRRSHTSRETLYRTFAGIDDCLQAALAHSLNVFFDGVTERNDWLDWLSGHRSEVAMIAWGLRIAPSMIEDAIDRAAGLLPIKEPQALGIAGGIYTAASTRLQADGQLDAKSVAMLRGFAWSFV